jgi:cardiolipin synthase
LTFESDELKAALDTPGKQLEALLSSSGLPSAVTGHRFSLLGSGTQAYATVSDMIAGANSSIDVQMYVLGNDAVGQPFVTALEEKVRAGIAVRVLLDRIGTWHRPRAELRRLTQAGGQVRYSSRLLHAPFKGHVNLRNHRKLILVDRHTVFSGGMNIAEEYLGPTPLASRWRDCAYRLQGPMVESFGQVFDSDWQTAGGAHHHRVGTPMQHLNSPATEAAPSAGSTVQLAVSGPDVKTDALHDALVLACYRADRRIWLVTPYFLPTPALSDAMSNAVHRGVDVRIVVPNRSNQWLADLSRGAYLRSAVDTGCQVYRFPGGMVHAKLAIMDEIGVIGSANLDMRSLLLNFEASLFTYSVQDVDQLVAWIEELLPECETGIAEVSGSRHLLERILSLGAPLL